MTLTNTQYEISGATLKIKKEGLTALGITDNSTAARALSLKENQIADATDATQKNAVTALNFKTEATATAATPPVVSSTDLGELDIFDAAGNVKSGAKIDITFDKEISLSADLKVQATGGHGADDVTLIGGYDINDKVLTITEAGIKALKLLPGGSIVLRGDQISGRGATSTIKDDITITHTEKEEAAPPAPDTKPEPNITTVLDTEFPVAGPIELDFENDIKLAPGKAFDPLTIQILELDDTNNPKPDIDQAPFSYNFTGKKLTITRSDGSEFAAETKYRVRIQPDVLLKDDGSPYAEDFVTYDFKAIDPVK